MYNTPIYWEKISLHYESRPTVFYTGTREQYGLMKQECYKTDWYIKRVTYSRWSVDWSKQDFELFRQQYSKLIQEKYKVGPDWQQNRWFMEQVRPTL